MNNTTAVWVKASDRLPEDLDTKFCRYPVDKEFYKFTAFCKEWENANGKKGWFNSDFEHYSEKVYLPNLFEWLDESPSPTEPGELEQDFKELNKYLDDLYNNHKNMDAGNLWIQFTDKFNDFRKKVLAMSSYRSMPLEDKGKEGWIDEVKCIINLCDQNGIPYDGFRFREAVLNVRKHFTKKSLL